MSLLEIKKLPDPVLRKKAREVKNYGDGFQKLIENMIETMRVEDGVGLAAPQVNNSSRVIVVEYPEDDSEEEPKAKLFIMVNPTIVKQSKETEFGIEGCLSVPDIVGEVERSTQIKIECFNRQGNKMRLKAKGWLARVFQHEIDHLNGILFVDRAVRIWRSDEEESPESELV